MFLFLLSFLLVQERIPYKPNEEFELKMDYQFKQRQLENSKTLDYGDDRQKNIGPLPYLGVELKVLKNDGEGKVRITDNTSSPVFTKKIKEGLVIKLDLGFTDDMKDRVTAHEYTFEFLSQDNKQPVSRIVIFVGEDGTLLVNGEKRGRL